MKRKVIIIIGIFFIFILGFIYRFGFAYSKKDIAGKYRQQITGQYYNLNKNIDPTFYLPDEYHFYGRYTFIGENYEDGLSIVYDRMVSKFFFEYGGEIYYLYVSDAINNYRITYPDIYKKSNDEKVIKLWKNPEGYFIIDNFLYYAYGRDYYHVKTFGAFITGHDFFIHNNYKDYSYARLNLDTMGNENISKDDYEKEYDLIK